VGERVGLAVVMACSNQRGEFFQERKKKFVVSFFLLPSTSQNKKDRDGPATMDWPCR
jgi:hypothetical protein